MRIGSWEHWTGTLMTLEEGLFFDLVRNYLGKLKTPFYKPNLVENLKKHLHKPEVMEKIFQHIKEKDRQLLCAIGLLPPGSIHPLVQFLGESWDFLSLFHQIRNLQERLLIFWEKTDEGEGWTLAPFLENELFSSVLNPSVLFPRKTTTPPAESMIWLGTGFALALKSFISHQKVEEDLQGQIKKRLMGRFKDVFGPFFLSLQWEDSVLPQALAWLGRLSLVEEISRRYRNKEGSWSQFWEIDFPRRTALLWAAWVMEEKTSVLPFAQSLLKLLRAIGPQGLDMEGQRRLHLLERFPWTWAPEVIDKLSQLGVLLESEGVYYSNPRAFPLLTQTPQRSVVSLGANFIFSLDLHGDWLQAPEAVVLGEVQKMDYMSSFLIGQQGVYQYLENSPKGPSPAQILEAFSSQDLPKNIQFSLTEWEGLFKAIRIQRGLVVSFDPDTLGFFQSVPGFQDLFLQDLGHGHYLMKESSLPILEEILEEQNRPIPPVVDHLTLPLVQGLRWAFYPWKLEEEASVLSLLPSEQWEEKDPEFIPLPPGLSQEEQEDYASRISRGLILFPQQIQEGLHPWEKTSAQGLDFLGKVRLIEAALKDKKWFLEIFRIGDKENQGLLLHPLNLDKKGKDTVLQGEILPQRSPFEIQASKIAKVRKVRALF